MFVRNLKLKQGSGSRGLIIWAGVLFWTTLVCAEETKNPVDFAGFVEARGALGSHGVGSGFLLNDGALLIGKQLGQGEIRLDFPFKGNLSGANNNFDFATEKAQAYIGYKYENGLRWKAGQFDALFGYESNDSVERRITPFGVVSNEFLIATHTGVVFGYEYSDRLGVTFLLANPNGMSALANRKPEYGFQLGTNTNGYRLQLGYSMNQDDNSLWNLQGGAVFGPLVADLEFDIRETAGFSDRAFGLATYWAYVFGSGFEFAWRLEYAKDAPVLSEVGMTYGTQYSGALSPQYQISKELKLRADYSVVSTRLTADAEAKLNHLAGVSVICQF